MPTAASTAFGSILDQIALGGRQRRQLRSIRLRSASTAMMPTAMILSQENKNAESLSTHLSAYMPRTG